MSKRKLSKQQLARIKHRQANLNNSDYAQAVVVTCHGQQAIIITSQGEQQLCQIRQNLDTIVSGDNVLFCPLDNVIMTRLPRFNELSRGTHPKKTNTVAANIDIVFIVLAVVPKPSNIILDSYLVAAEYQKMNAHIIINKIDMANTLDIDLSIYESLNYPLHFVSAKTGQGLADIKQALHGKRGILVGQSGVGKSSLTQQLNPTATVAIGELTSNLGNHKTSHTQLYPLGDNSFLLDSPGIRDFSIQFLDTNDIIRGFSELRDYQGHCKFRNCQHQQEPGCAFQQGLAEGRISIHRFNSLQQMLAKKLS